MGKMPKKAKRGGYQLSESIVALQDSTAADIKSRIKKSVDDATKVNRNQDEVRAKLLADEENIHEKADCSNEKRAEIDAIRKNRDERVLLVAITKGVIDSETGKKRGEQLKQALAAGKGVLLRQSVEPITTGTS